MIRSSTAFASLFALALAAGAAQAQAPRDGSAAALEGNVVGGGVATITGGGDNTTYQAAPAGARFEEPRVVGRLSGGGDDETITYTAPVLRAGRPGGTRG